MILSTPRRRAKHAAQIARPLGRRPADAAYGLVFTAVP